MFPVLGEHRLVLSENFLEITVHDPHVAVFLHALRFTNIGAIANSRSQVPEPAIRAKLVHTLHIKRVFRCKFVEANHAVPVILFRCR